MSLVKWGKQDLSPFDSWWDDFFGRGMLNRGWDLGTRVPAVNVSETDKAYRLEVAIPGHRKEDFRIDVDNGVLTLSSEKKEEKEEKDGQKITRREFSYSSFQRSFGLPDNVNADAISAEYRDGLLTVDIPKTEPSKSASKKQITIR